MASSLRRLAAVLLAIAVLLPWRPAAAADTFVPLSPFMLEIWDSYGVFHMVDIQLSVAFPAKSNLNKMIGTKIQQALQTLPYDELTKPSGGATIKSMALAVIRADPTGATAEEVLIQKLMFR